MKTVDAIYEAQEMGVTRRPIELYHFWWEYRTWPYTWKQEETLPAADQELHYYYTSCEDEVVYDGQTYTPAAIGRGAVESQAKFEPSQLSINVNIVEPVVQYIAMNPVDIINVRVIRLYRDAGTAASLIFMGQIKTVSFQGPAASIRCTGFENRIMRPIPKFRYQPMCNWTLFDDMCKVDPASYMISATVAAIGTNRNYITWSGTAQTTGTFIRGMISYNETERRMIVDEPAPYQIVTRYPILSLTVGAAIKLYQGCDGQVSTCYNKFGNINRHMGFPYIPWDNPALRGGK